MSCYSSVSPLLLALLFALNVGGEDDVDRAFAWCKKQGVDGLDSRIGMGSFDGIRGLKALEFIPAGAVLLKSPKENLIHPKLLMREYGEWGSDKMLAGLHADQRLALLLLVERSKPVSKWQPFFDMLPRDAIPSMNVTEDDLGRLNETVSQFTFGDAVRKIQKEADQLCHFAQTKLPITVEGAQRAEIFTQGACRWAYSMVKSRSWSLDVHGDDQPGDDTTMVPCLDLINHHHEGDILTIDDGPTPGSKEVTMRAKRSYQAGEQVFIKYGHYAMESAYAIYGFASGEMPLWMIFSPEGHSPGGAVNEFGYELASSIGCDKLHASEATGINHEYLGKLITCSRMMQITPVEFQAAEQDGSGIEKLFEPFDDQIEIAALSQLAKSITFHLSAHDTTEPEARSPGQKLISSLLQSEKSWLKTSLAEVKVRWAKHLRRRDLVRQGLDPDQVDDHDQGDIANALRVGKDET